MTDPNGAQGPDGPVAESKIDVDIEELEAGVEIEVNLESGKNQLIVRVLPRRYLFSV